MGGQSFHGQWIHWPKIIDQLIHCKISANYTPSRSAYSAVLAKCTDKYLQQSETFKTFSPAGGSAGCIRKFSQIKSDVNLYDFRRVRWTQDAAPHPPVSVPTPVMLGCQERCRGQGQQTRATALFRIITDPPPDILFCRLLQHKTAAATRDLTCQRTTQP